MYLPANLSDTDPLQVLDQDTLRQEIVALLYQNTEGRDVDEIFAQLFQQPSCRSVLTRGRWSAFRRPALQVVNATLKRLECRQHRRPPTCFRASLTLSLGNSRGFAGR